MNRRAKTPPKALGWASPAAGAAAEMLKKRSKSFGKAAKTLAQADVSAPQHAELVHALRVASRRAEAAIDAFADLGDQALMKRFRKRVDQVRREAGLVRDLDVQASLLRRVVERDAPRLSKAARARAAALAEQCQQRRLRAAKRLRRELAARTLERVDKAWGKALDSIVETPAPVLRDHAAAVLGQLMQRVSEAAVKDIGRIKRLHELRVAVKALRYGLEVFDPWCSAEFRVQAATQFAAMQDALGEVNDADVLVRHLREHTDQEEDPTASAEIARLLEVELTRRDRAHHAFLKTWEKFEPAGLVESIRAELVRGSDTRDTAGASWASIVELKPARAGEAHQPASVAHAESTKNHGKRQRIAAIDVGTNSIRLIVAEVGEDGGYRVLDDEKELTRLGRGLHESGELHPDAIEHSAATIANMKAIASGYGASIVQAVATAAAREATNAARLVKVVRERAGLELRIISGDEEAMLAFRSASRAFDLASQPSMVMDIGGGSTEIILSAPPVGASSERRSGVIERVYSLPLGAVRLTEMFGGPEKAAGKRFKAMRAHAAEVLRKSIGRPPMIPSICVGTGGTITTLAAIVHERGGQGGGLFSGSVQGADIARADLKHIIERLRSMSLKDRTKVPGLPPERADIILAGLVVADEVLKRFAVNRLRAHEGGIRDGLLLSMVAERSGTNVPPEHADPLRGVRRFARACAYEESHSEHVTKLALTIFDQLAKAGAAPLRVELTPRLRQILEAASVLHDVGYLISYSQHHKHSYHLIVHADLPGWSNQEVQIIANVARYHRSSEPKTKHKPFSDLSSESQAVVRILAGILRVADGLDRTHSQAISEVGVEWRRSGGVVLRVRSHAEPGVDLWGAERKGGLLREVLGSPISLVWEGLPGDDRGSENPKIGVGETLEVRRDATTQSGRNGRKSEMIKRKP